MARISVSRFELTAPVRLESPLHIGGPGAGTGDATVLRDGRDRPILPGSSLTGALRAALGEADPERDAREMRWGGAEGTYAGASRVTIPDTVLTPPAGGVYRLGRRDGVALNRAWGSAADGRLYGREVVPAGWEATIVVEVESLAETEADDLTLLADIREILVSGLWLGARTSRGHGHIRAEAAEIAVAQRRFDTAEGYWTTRRKPCVPARRPSTLKPGSVVEVTIDWEPRGPVAVGGTPLIEEVAFAPLLETADGDGELRMVLPGTSIAGALRARAELICRTIAGRSVPDDIDSQLSDCPLVTMLFGAASGRHGASWSALQIPDCASTTTLTGVAVEQAARREKRPSGPQLRRTEHVAVDRWTGGASAGRLFSELEPHGFAFGPLILRLHLDRLGERAAVGAMLLLVTVRELCEHRIPLGAKVLRGFGEIEVNRVRVTGPEVDYCDTSFPDLTDHRFAEWRREWQAYWMTGESG